MSVGAQVFKETYAFLEQNISESFYCEDFNKELTQKLYNHLRYHFDEQTLINERPNIRKALKSYFSLFRQRISVLFKGLDLIIIKDLKKNVFKEHSAQFHKMSQCLVSLAPYLDNFKVNAGVYMIPPDQIANVGCSFENIKDEALKKELYRESAKVAFDLEDKDLVFFVNDKLTIKKFLKDTKNIERRAYGLPPEELEKLKNIVFEKNVQDEIQQAITLLTKTTLNFAVISNEFFRKNSIALVQNALYQVASIFLNEDSHEALKKAFVNYIFRENFIKIHRYFAKELIELHAYRKKNAEKFLRFFDGKIEMIDGRQVKKPDIVDAKNQRWNAVSILPVAIGKIRGDKEISSLKDTLQNTTVKITELNEKRDSLEKELAELQENKDSIDAKIYNLIQESKKLQDKNYNLKRQRIRGAIDANTQQEINGLVIEIKKYNKEEEALRKLSRETNSALEILKTRIENVNTEIQIQERFLHEQRRKIENLTKTYAPIYEKYDLIVDAVAKTLTIRY